MTDEPVLLCSMLLAKSAVYVRARPLRRAVFEFGQMHGVTYPPLWYRARWFHCPKSPLSLSTLWSPQVALGRPCDVVHPTGRKLEAWRPTLTSRHSPLHPPIPWSPHPRGAHRTFLPLPRPCCSLRSKKHMVWGAGPWKLAHREGTFPKTKSALRRSTQGVTGPGAPSPGDHAHSPWQETSPGALWFLRGQCLSEVALPTGRLVPRARFWLSAWVGGGQTCRAPLCTEGPPGHEQLARTPAVPGGSPRARARDTGGCRALYPENAEPSTTNSKKTNAPNENDLHSPFCEESLQTHGKMLTMVSDQGKVRQVTGGTTSLPAGG